MTQVTKVQHRVLSALPTAKEGALPRKSILEKCFNGNAVNLKKILDPLVDAKLVTAKEIELDGGKTEMSFSVTAAGKKIADKPAPVSASSAEHKALPPVGETFEKTYKGKKVTVKVVEDGFKIGSSKYASLTAAAKAVRGTDQEVNGWAFFGLTKKSETAKAE